MKRVYLRYRGVKDGILAFVVYTWRRGEIPELKMSTSSGPKDTTANQIFMAFQQVKDAQQISLCVARCVPFVIYHIGCQTCDCTGRPVEWREVAAA